MKLIYVAGPYKGKSEYEIQQNIRRAEALGLKIWKEGCAAIVPHMNTANWGGAVHPNDPTKDRQVWLEGDLEIVRRCDAIVATDNWPFSEGARAEVDLMKNKLGKPVFTESDWASFLNWLISEKTKEN